MRILIMDFRENRRFLLLLLLLHFTQSHTPTFKHLSDKRVNKKATNNKRAGCWQERKCVAVPCVFDNVCMNIKQKIVRVHFERCLLKYFLFCQSKINIVLWYHHRIHHFPILYCTFLLHNNIACYLSWNANKANNKT